MTYGNRKKKATKHDTPSTSSVALRMDRRILFISTRTQPDLSARRQYGLRAGRRNDGAGGAQVGPGAIGDEAMPHGVKVAYEWVYPDQAMYLASACTSSNRARPPAPFRPSAPPKVI